MNEPIENVASEHANDSYNNYNDIPSPAHELCKLISLSKTNLSKTNLSKTNLSKTNLSKTNLSKTKTKRG